MHSSFSFIPETRSILQYLNIPRVKIPLACPVLPYSSLQDFSYLYGKVVKENAGISEEGEYLLIWLSQVSS